MGKIKIIEGNLLDTDAPIIMHQVNCQGKMNSGVAKAIREKWPVVYQKYIEHYDKCFGTMGEGHEKLLGTVLPVTVNDRQKVMNLYGQNKYGYDGCTYTSYDAIYKCLCKVADYCTEKGIDRVALPYMMSCARGGANWTIVLTMIEEAFRGKDITIEIWKYDRDN